MGELLARLPPGSLGLEVNPATVTYCRGLGLNVEYYDPAGDGYQFEDLPADAYTTFVMSHVLEHLKDPDQVLRSILRSCERLGISSVILIVPGAKGFAFDHTHKTFIDEAYLGDHDLWNVPPWTVHWKEYFPFNAPWVGRYFTYHELLFIYEKRC